MIFHSTRDLRKLIVKHELDYLVLDEYENVSVGKLIDQIERLARKHKIYSGQIKFYRKNNISINEFGNTEDRLIFFYETEETEKEYKERIEKSEVRDLQDSITEVRKFVVCINQKQELKKLYEKIVKKGKYKGLKSTEFESFLSEESTEERVDKAYKRGYSEGQKIVKELKDKIKNL
jgi:hypothetical protein